MLETTEIPVQQALPAEDATEGRAKLSDYDRLLAGYRGPSSARSLWQLTSTLALFAAGWAAMYWSLSISYFLTLILALPTSLMVVRIFIFQHDCGHRSFFRTKALNNWVGRALGVLTWTPFDCWRRRHAIHHANSGDLDRRGTSGEIYTMTVDEYQRASRLDRLRYRIYRHPLVLFGLGSFYQFVIRQRFAYEVPASWKRERLSVYLTNVALLLVVVIMSYLVGWQAFLLVEIPVMALAAGIGVWMFYIQHQYEEAFWERNQDWSYVDAAMLGSSYYRLPALLQWLTGNIGLHHIHHLDARIPNYRLQPCHDSHPELQRVHEFSFLESLACIRANLWDEEQRKMVSFAASNRSAGQRS